MSSLCSHVEGKPITTREGVLQVAIAMINQATSPVLVHAQMHSGAEDAAGNVNVLSFQETDKEAMISCAGASFEARASGAIQGVGSSMPTDAQPQAVLDMHADTTDATADASTTGAHAASTDADAGTTNSDAGATVAEDHLAVVVSLLTSIVKRRKAKQDLLSESGLQVLAHPQHRDADHMGGRYDSDESIISLLKAHGVQPQLIQHLSRRCNEAWVDAGLTPDHSPDGARDAKFEASGLLSKVPTSDELLACSVLQLLSKSRVMSRMQHT